MHRPLITPCRHGRQPLSAFPSLFIHRQRYPPYIRFIRPPPQLPDHPPVLDIPHPQQSPSIRGGNDHGGISRAGEGGEGVGMGDEDGGAEVSDGVGGGGGRVGRGQVDHVDMAGLAAGDDKKIGGDSYETCLMYLRISISSFRTMLSMTSPLGFWQVSHEAALLTQNVPPAGETTGSIALPFPFTSTFAPEPSAGCVPYSNHMTECLRATKNPPFLLWKPRIRSLRSAHSVSYLALG